MMGAALPAQGAAPQGPVLRDIHMPPDPPWWPPAPGWWMLAALFVVAVLCAIAWWRRHRRKLEGRERVLAELDRLVDQHAQSGDHVALASGMHQLLRRVARRHDAASTQQRGASWRRTLARMPVDTATLDRLLELEQVIYRPSHSFDAAAAVNAVRRWMILALKPSAWKQRTEHAHA
ncbi:DUF4381 family protein [Rhodanobacter sp. L36]|uniref:DUF4381 family protein n=1 Tax=Rhodanobacter sp. L36 TaxID=1747221 RepID=UPI00131AD695|nr:DUF4381 family protein [Rhodanobacter sp. L36]